MRAFDEIDAPDQRRDRCRQLTGEITSRRVAIWRNEHELIRQWADTEEPPQKVFFHSNGFTCGASSLTARSPAVDTEILLTIRQQKRISTLVLERLKIAGSSNSLPDHYEGMWLKWEHDPDYERVPLPPVRGAGLTSGEAQKLFRMKPVHRLRQYTALLGKLCALT